MRPDSCPLLYSGAVQHRRPPASRARSHGQRPQLGRWSGTAPRLGAKLLDFNIASRVGDPVYTQSGTPPYQAPDVDLTRWDVSTDLLAVGVMLYELLCDGHHPYPGSRRMIGEKVIDPRTIRPELSDAMSPAMPAEGATLAGKGPLRGELDCQGQYRFLASVARDWAGGCHRPGR